MTFTRTEIKRAIKIVIDDIDACRIKVLTSPDPIERSENEAQATAKETRLAEIESLLEAIP